MIKTRSKFLIFIGFFFLIFCLFTPAQAAETKWTPPNIQISIPNLSFSAPEQCGPQNGQPVYCGEYLTNI
jgi:hypothetical protein